MISYLLDTDWIVDFLNGKARATRLVGSLADEGIAISIITYGELYEGLASSPDREARQEQLEEFARTVDVLSIDFAVARLFGEQKASLRRRGQPIPDLDLLIAATVLRYDLTLVSRDKHFERIPELKRLQPD